MADEVREALNHIRQLGFRLTPQRQLILETLHDQGGHATAATLYERARIRMPALNLATVYRTLEFFCRLRLASKTEIGGETVFEVVAAVPHHHLVCARCHHIEVLADYHFEALVTHLLEEHQFKAILDHLVIEGVCVSCLQRTEDRGLRIADRGFLYTWMGRTRID